MSEKWLSTNGFQLVSALVLDADGRMSLSRWDRCDEAVRPLSVPSLYVFLEREEDTVVYIGKAGKGWDARRPQHNGGYERARKGLTSPAHQARIAQLRDLLIRDNRVSVFERAVFSLNAIDDEERDLIRMFKPPFNVKNNT